MALLSAFEILAENLVPQGILPPTAPNPFALQGYWVQISLAPGFQSSTFNIIYQETTDFRQGAGQVSLQAQIIDASGNVSIYSGFFASTGRGFLSQTIFAGQTIIYGVQCIPGSIVKAAIPQSGTGWRGTVQVNPQQAGSLVATPTQRLVYYNIGAIVTGTVISACVYPVPTFSGGTKI